MPGRTTNRGKKELKITQIQDSPQLEEALSVPFRGFSQRQPHRDSVGNDGSKKAIKDTALEVTTSFLDSEGSFWSRNSADSSPADKNSLEHLPKSESTPVEASVTHASPAAALGEVQGSRKVQGQVDPGGRGQEESPDRRVQGRWALQKSSKLPDPEEHHGAKPYVCQLCGKAYSHRSTLQQHRRLHTGERPYRCPFCDKAYTWSSDHRKHIRTHTGERPFHCAECGQTFARSSTLKRHQQIHAGDKDFLCAECGRAFRIASELAQHIRMHNGERPYKCEGCGQAFTRSNHLQRHQAKHETCKKEPAPSSSNE
ncbi:Zinc finger protein 648 [Lemmus lemmus]